MKRLLATFLVSATLAIATPLAAQERILSYDSEVQVHADGSLDVTERIRVRAEGDQIRRGIYRDFPTRYRNRQGNRAVVDLEVIDVLRDGQPEPWFTERRNNGVRINTGNDDFLPVPAEFTYTLRYRTNRQLGFFDAHDELYWNAIGTGWDFMIERGSVDVRLPQPVPVGDMATEAYTGAQGMQGGNFIAEPVAPGRARWTLTAPLQPREGFTIVLSFPKGVAIEPSPAQKAWWLLRDNRAGLVALAGLLLLLAYCITRWRQVGRDPRAGPVVVQYDPPDDLSPSALRYIRRRSHDTPCFSADVLSLAVGGHLGIHRDKGLLKDDWTLERTGAGGRTHGPEQDALLSHLFAGGDRIELKNTNAATLQKAMAAHARALQQRFKGRMFNTNGGSVLVAFLIALGFSVAAILIAATTGSGLLLAIPLVALMFAVAFVFAILVAAPTPEGRSMLDRIEGLRRYLGVAEKQDLQRLQGPGDREPELDARRFEFLLPYAVALGVEDAWTKKFTLAVGAAAAAAATSAIAWYHGSGRGGIGDLGSFSKSIGSSLASQIASSSSPPGSSSGGGGGGFSGGGGGGGGGGGR